MIYSLIFTFVEKTKKLGTTVAVTRMLVYILEYEILDCIGFCPMMLSYGVLWNNSDRITVKSAFKELLGTLKYVPFNQSSLYTYCELVPCKPRLYKELNCKATSFSVKKMINAQIDNWQNDNNSANIENNCWFQIYFKTWQRYQSKKKFLKPNQSL